jgi:hypothetical protein
MKAYILAIMIVFGLATTFVGVAFFSETVLADNAD